MALDATLKTNVVPTSFPRAVELAVEALKSGGVVALPTDTVYGVCATVRFSKKLYDVKGRPETKPLGVFLSSASEVYKVCTPRVDDRLLNALLPGPVTLVFERAESLPDDFNPGTASVGVRVPNDALVREICSKVGEPIAQTSANLSGEPSPTSVHDFEALHTACTLILDGGGGGGDRTRPSNSAGSTIVSFVDVPPKTYKIVRDGCALEETESVLKKHGFERVDE